jgi:ribonuclease HI
VHDALAAEGEACLAALNAAMDVGISHVMLETDSLTLIAAIRSPTYDQAPGGAIFQEIRDALYLHFHVHGVYHIPRSCNKCAHELARSGLARDPDTSIFWNDPLAGSVISLVSRDHSDSLVDE